MNQKAPCYLQGVGTAVPPRALNAEESAALLRPSCRDPRTAKLLRRVTRLTGIEKRHLAVLDHQSHHDGKRPLYLAAEEQPAGPGMGARNALFERCATPLVKRAVAEFSPALLSGVQALVTVSCTHASSPGLERPVFLQTPVPTSVDRWNLGFMGCSAALAAIRLIHRLAARDRSALIVACELSSLHFQYSDQLDQLTANVLFADGAAATVLSSIPTAVRIADCRCESLPKHADQMVWFADDHGLRLELSQDLPETLGGRLPYLVDDFLEQNGLSRVDINHWLVHPGGPQVLDSVDAALGLPDDALDLSRSVLRHYGNMSSPTILFIMRELFATQIDGWAVAMAFGPGLTIELVLLEIDRGRG